MSDAIQKRGRLSNDERDTLERYALRGLKPGQIAMRMQRNPSTITFAMTAMGLREPSQIKRPIYTDRNGVDRHGYSPEEDALMADLQEQMPDLPLHVIAEILTERFGHRRTEGSVWYRLKSLVARAEHGGTDQ